MFSSILLTGASGFLGHFVGQVLTKDFEVYATYKDTPLSLLSNWNTIQIDLTEYEAEDFSFIFEYNKIDAIIHLAAASQPNFCQNYSEESYSINVKASTELAKCASKLNIPFFFASTDLVFNGQNAPYKETDTPNPISIYGQHKLEAERAVLALHPSATIVRLPLMYGHHPAQMGFYDNWVYKLDTRADLYAFTDEYRTPAHALDVAQGIRLLLEKEKTGIWHLGGPERMSRFEFAQRMASAMRIESPNIIPSIRADVNMAAPRPADVSLNSEKAFAIGYQPLKLEETIEEVK